VVVTGASSGLGLAVAEAMAREGARLAIVARREAPLRAAAERLRSAGAAEVFALPADLDDDGQRRTAWRTAVAALGPPAAVVVNTGNPVGGFVVDPDHAAYADGWVKMRQVMDLDRLAAEAMAGGGAVVNVLSRTAVEPDPDLLVSSWVRAGLLAYAKAVSLRWAARGVRVLSVLPGLTRTAAVDAGLAARAATAGASLDAQAAAEGRAVPLGRLGDMASFGRLVAFLASPACDYVTGSAVRFDGGAVRSV
jgi:3-oxoacyl-[acyl-carrier protein] reductase